MIDHKYVTTQSSTHCTICGNVPDCAISITMCDSLAIMPTHSILVCAAVPCIQTMAQILISQIPVFVETRNKALASTSP